MASKPTLVASLVPVISKIREALEATGTAKTLDLGLPQIVVVGSQSAGKSSVLENIVGHTILPRGTGIVTRVPLILTLHCPEATELEEAKNDPKHSGEQDEWAEFLHLPHERFFDFDEVRDMIQSRTDFLAGSDRGVVDEPIHLKVSSPRFMELTLVDLPGITRVAVGDQPADIEARIRDLCLSYISKENSIILAITAANTDLANSDSLQLARSVDPRGLRTIGVLTKVDLMDPGTDCSEVLLNRVLPLHLGYVAVVNRGQKDIQQGVCVKTALQAELEFFKTNPAYGGGTEALSALKGCLGTEALVCKLSSHLHLRIDAALPSLRKTVAGMLQDASEERKALGEQAVPTMTTEAKRRCLDELTSFSQRFRDELEGNVFRDMLGEENSHGYGEDGGSYDGYGGEEEEEEEEESFDHLECQTDQHPQGGGVSGVAAITHVFDELFAGSIAAIDALDGLSERYIRRVIDNSNTLPPSLFVPEKAFHSLVKEQIARLEQPGILCVELVHARLLAIAKRCIRRQLGGLGGVGGRGGGGGGGNSGSINFRFPVLAQRIEELVTRELGPMAENCKSKVRDMIDFELEYINTKHPDFVECQDELLPSLLPQQQQQQQQGRDKEEAEAAAAAAAQRCAAGEQKEQGRGDEFNQLFGVEDVDDEDSSSSSSQPSPPLERKHPENQQQGDGPPGWLVGLFGGGHQNHPHHLQQQSRPRRGGRRSSFGIMDEQALDAFRKQTASSTVLHHAVASEPSRPQQQQQQQQQRIGTKVAAAPPVAMTRKEREVAVVQHLIRRYFDIVARDFCDKVPKAIMCTMVNKLKKTIQNELITALYESYPVAAAVANPAAAAAAVAAATEGGGEATIHQSLQTEDIDLMGEPSDVCEKRREAKAREACLLKASLILDKASRALVQTHQGPSSSFMGRQASSRPSSSSSSSSSSGAGDGLRRGGGSVRNPMTRIAKSSLGNITSPPPFAESGGVSSLKGETNHPTGLGTRLDLTPLGLNQKENYL